MSVGETWDNAQAAAQKVLGKDGKLPKMPVDLEKLAEDYNRALDGMKPPIQAVGQAWESVSSKSDDVTKGCDTLTKTVSGDDFGLDSKNPDQAKKQKAAKAILSSALTSIKGVVFKRKQENVSWVTKQVQGQLK